MAASCRKDRKERWPSMRSLFSRLNLDFEASPVARSGIAAGFSNLRDRERGQGWQMADLRAFDPESVGLTIFRVAPDQVGGMSHFHGRPASGVESKRRCRASPRIGSLTEGPSRSNPSPALPLAAPAGPP